MNLIDFVVVELSRRTIQHSRFEMASEGADMGDAFPAGGSASPPPPSDTAPGDGAGPAGPMVNEVPAADGPAAQAAAHPPEVMALPQQVLASNQAIVASTQAIAARVTAIEIAQGRACSTC